MTNDKNAEVDMGYIHSVFRSLADTIVAASELPKQIQDMQDQMRTLDHDLTQTKERNIQLDTLLADTRRQRDEANEQLRQVKSTLDNVSREHDRNILTLKEANDEARLIQSRLETVIKERDDYGLAHMAADDRATQAEAKLKKLREALGMTEPVEFVPIKEVLKQPEPIPALPPIQAVGDGPTETLKPIEPEVDWNKPYRWDDYTQKYVNV